MKFYNANKFFKRKLLLSAKTPKRIKTLPEVL